MNEQKKALVAVAVASVKDSILWEINNKQDTFDSPESRNEYANIHAEERAAIDDYIAAGGMVTNRSIIGELRGDTEVRHYDIDDAINKKFSRNKVSTDSESGGFYCYMDASVVDEVEAFLKENYPDLHYGVHTDDENAKPITLSNWNCAKRILEKAGVTVDYSPSISVPVKDAEEINKLLDEASHAIFMTGLATEEEIANTLSGYREAAV